MCVSSTTGCRGIGRVGGGRWVKFWLFGVSWFRVRRFVCWVWGCGWLPSAHSPSATISIYLSWTYPHSFSSAGPVQSSSAPSCSPPGRTSPNTSPSHCAGTRSAPLSTSRRSALCTPTATSRTRQSSAHSAASCSPRTVSPPSPSRTPSSTTSTIATSTATRSSTKSASPNSCSRPTTSVFTNPSPRSPVSTCSPSTPPPSTLSCSRSSTSLSSETQKTSRIPSPSTPITYVNLIFTSNSLSKNADSGTLSTTSISHPYPSSLTPYHPLSAATPSPSGSSWPQSA